MHGYHNSLWLTHHLCQGVCGLGVLSLFLDPHLLATRFLWLASVGQLALFVHRIPAWFALLFHLVCINGVVWNGNDMIIWFCCTLTSAATITNDGAEEGWHCVPFDYTSKTMLTIAVYKKMIHEEICQLAINGCRPFAMQQTCGKKRLQIKWKELGKQNKCNWLKKGLLPWSISNMQQSTS